MKKEKVVKEKSEAKEMLELLLYSKAEYNLTMVKIKSCEEVMQQIELLEKLVDDNKQQAEYDKTKNQIGLITKLVLVSACCANEKALLFGSLALAIASIHNVQGLIECKKNKKANDIIEENNLLVKRINQLNLDDLKSAKKELEESIDSIQENYGTLLKTIDAVTTLNMTKEVNKKFDRKFNKEIKLQEEFRMATQDALKSSELFENNFDDNNNDDSNSIE